MQSQDKNELRGKGGENTALPTTSSSASLPAPTLVERPQFVGWLYSPVEENDAGLRAAIIVLPPPDEEPSSLDAAVAALLDNGFVVLVIEWDEQLEYPESLAILPGAVSFLAGLANVDPARVGALGVEIGGDLVLRAASTDPQVASVLAFGPLLTPAIARKGLLSLLKRSRPRDWDAYVERIDSLEAARCLATRPVKIVFGEKDNLIDTAKALQELSVIAMEDRLTILKEEKQRRMIRSPGVIQLAVDWFLQTL